MNDLISAWRELCFDKPPYALPADLVVLEESGSHVVIYYSYESYSATALENPNDSRFHLGLLPQPWFGDLTSATVFVLMLNPGLNPGDYYAEYRVPDFRTELIKNLQQQLGREYPLLFLDPELAWHPGSRYVRARLHWLAKAIVQQQGRQYREALALLARRICWLQLVPYHSPKYRLSSRLLNRLTSANLAKVFARENLLPRKDVLIIVTRQSTEWALQRRANIVQYEGSETRSAHLSPKSPGGRALLAHFGLRTIE